MKCSLMSLAAFAIASPVAMAQELPPFDFSDQFYTSHGLDIAHIPGRPTGVAPGSVIDNRANGPDFNNVRVRQQVAAFDQSGHPIFFYVTGVLNQGSFLNNSAGQAAQQIAETYNVYEFPRAGNAQFIVFPKRQDLIADLRNGYFSHNPMGMWKINTVKYTPAAFNTDHGRAALADLLARNGHDLDGTPLVRTISEIEDLQDDGLVTVETPPAAGGGPGVLRWFLCPVIEDPRNGVIAPDAFPDIIQGTSATLEFTNLFNCLQVTGDDHCDTPACSADFNRDGDVGTDADIEAFFACLGGNCCAACRAADFNGDGDVGTDGDIEAFFRVLGGGNC